MTTQSEIEIIDNAEVLVPDKSSIILYTTEDGKVQLDVHIDKDTVWLNVDQMSMLFGRDRTVIGRHIANVFKQGEVAPEVGCAKFAHTTQHGAIPEKTQTSVQL